MALNSGKILMRRGQEVNFDPNKMMPGEWAVSLDSKFVRMCFSPGVCIRMATYEAFEADMEQIREILAECQTVEEAVQRIYEDIKDVAVDVERIEAAAASALESEENALNSANLAVQSANTATQKAEEAEESANIASTKAEQATEGANTATQKASEAAESAGNVRNMSEVSESYAVGGTGTREGEDTDNAKYYNQQASDNADRAEAAAERASAVADVGVATTEKAGLVKPDGETIRVDSDGTIHADRGTTSYSDLENKPKINDVVLEGNKTIDDLGGLTAESTVSFLQASERTNIEATDNVKGIFGKVKKWFADLKPHAFSNPTNNLLATVAGTALDAVQGKVLYDRDINMSVGRLAFQNKNAFGTLEEFVQETAKDIGTPIIARLRDTTGAWGPGGNIQWYKCLLAYQNPYGSQYSLGGAGFMWDDARNKWSIEITGNSNTTINFKYEKLITETELNSILKTKFNHKEYISWTSIASGSYAAGEKRYTKTDIGLIKELLFVFQENSVYESMAYEYVSITTGFGNLTTSYYQAQTTKGLFRIYYSEEGYIDIREVPNGLGIRAALYLPKI